MCYPIKVETTTTSAPDTSVLVLNTWLDVNKRLIIDEAGNSDRNFFFTFGNNTEAWASCSVVWRNKMLVLGGATHRKQISEVSRCQLKRTGTLPHELYYGACTTTVELVYLCFDYENPHVCFTTDDFATFYETQPSLYPHRRTAISSSSTEILVVGDETHSVAELFDFKDKTWKTSTNYPADTIYFTSILTIGRVHAF